MNKSKRAKTIERLKDRIEEASARRWSLSSHIEAALNHAYDAGRRAAIAEAARARREGER